MTTAAEQRKRLESHPGGRWLIKHNKNQLWLARKAKVSPALVSDWIARKLRPGAEAGMRLWRAMDRDVPLYEIFRKPLRPRKAA